MKLSEALKKRQEENRKYWQDREEAALQTYIKDENEYSKHIQKIYSNMLADVQTQINAFYGRYADKEGITLAEAKKRVAKLDIEAYERKAKKYVEEKDFSKKANEEMRLYNATMKINRLEMLKANIGLEMIAGTDELDKYMESILQGRTADELKRQAGILGDNIRDNAKMAHNIVNASFHNATFSNRIWLYQDLLRNDLDKLLQQGLIQGKNPRVLAKEVKKAFNTSTYNAERLMRTEMARVQTAAQEASLRANGFEMYQFNVNGGCCPICEEAADKDNGHGKGVYMLSNIQYGYNAPPLHPHCRCSISSYMSRAAYEEWIDRLKSGEKITWQEFNSHRVASGKSQYKEYLQLLDNGKVELRAKQRKILDAIPQQGEWVELRNKQIDIEDLAALTAYTGDEFALFSGKNSKIVIHGHPQMWSIPQDAWDIIVENQYIWAAHSHPTMTEIKSSYEDRKTLQLLTWQEKSVIIDLTGNTKEFTASEQDWFNELLGVKQ